MAGFLFSNFMKITNTAVNNVNIHGYEELVTIDEIRARVRMTDHAMETIEQGRD